MPSYTDMLAAYGVSIARPGGKEVSNYVLDAAPINGKSVLEVGSGLGETANLLNKKYNVSVTALDSHPKMINKAKERYKDNSDIQWVLGDLLSFHPLTSYDLCIIESVLSFTDISSSLKKIHSLLKENGKLYLLEGIYLRGLSHFELEKYKRFYGLRSLLTKEEWVAILKKHYFSVIDIISSEHVQSETTNSFPELILDEKIKEDYVNILNEHTEYTNQYLAFFDYAYFICEKKTKE